MNLGNDDLVRIKLQLLRQLSRLPLTEAQIEQVLRYLDAYLEETEPGAVQRTLAAMNQPEYREAGMLIEYVKNEGRAEGARAKALEDATKMRGHGIAWDIVTDVTGIKPEDLEKAAPKT